MDKWPVFKSKFKTSLENVDITTVCHEGNVQKAFATVKGIGTPPFHKVATKIPDQGIMSPCDQTNHFRIYVAKPDRIWADAPIKVHGIQGYVTNVVSDHIATQMPRDFSPMRLKLRLVNTLNILMLMWVMISFSKIGIIFGSKAFATTPKMIGAPTSIILHSGRFIGRLEMANCHKTK